MPFALTMPKLSPTMEEGAIVKWHKAEGDEIKDGDLLFEVATDKATVEHNALDGGFLRKILVPEGSSATVNQPVAILTADATESIEGFTVETPKEEKIEEVVEKQEKAPSKKQTGGMATPEFAPPPPLENYEFEWPTEPPSLDVKASPLAKRLAKERGLDLTTVKGSGPGGRIVEADLNRAQEAAPATFGVREKPKEQPGSFDSEPLSPMRKVIAERLQESKTFIPHFYVQHEVNAAALIETREQLKANGVKLTFNDFVVRATAIALKKYPGINSGFNSQSNTITRYKTVDIAIAVNIDEGLITPIVRHADYKSIAQLSKEVKLLATAAKQGKLQPEQYQGGSFTISNLGMFGVIDFQAIINPPQAGILSVGGILDKPVVKGPKVVPGKVMQLSLSVDHRVIDGALAAEFLGEIKKLLESPTILVV